MSVSPLLNSDFGKDPFVNLPIESDFALMFTNPSCTKLSHQRLKDWLPFFRVVYIFFQ